VSRQLLPGRIKKVYWGPSIDGCLRSRGPGGILDQVGVVWGRPAQAVIDGYWLDFRHDLRVKAWLVFPVGCPPPARQPVPGGGRPGSTLGIWFKIKKFQRPEILIPPLAGEPVNKWQDGREDGRAPPQNGFTPAANVGEVYGELVAPKGGDSNMAHTAIKLNLDTPPCDFGVPFSKPSDWLRQARFPVFFGVKHAPIHGGCMTSSLTPLPPARRAPWVLLRVPTDDPFSAQSVIFDSDCLSIVKTSGLSENL